MRTILTLASTVLLLAPACAPAGGTNDGRLAVVTSFYPVAFAAERIGGPCVAVRNLTPPGIEPHDLELTPDGIEAIASADVVLYLGGGFQPAIEDAVDEAGGRVVDVLQGVPTEEPTSDETGEGLTVDPHVWLDPDRFALIARRIESSLRDLGAPSDCRIGQRADGLDRELSDLDDAFRMGLSSCEHDVIVTNHAAFGYLADAYGLRQEAIAGLEPEVEPNPRRLVELKELVEREGVTTIFTEELVSPEVADTLAREAGVTTTVLFTIEGLTSEEAAAGHDYLSLMEEDLHALRSALRCA